MRKLMYLFIGIIGLWGLLSYTGLTVNGEKWDIWFPLKFKISKKKGVEVNTVPYPYEELKDNIKKEYKKRCK
jgi:hypothetical protein